MATATKRWVHCPPSDDLNFDNDLLHERDDGWYFWNETHTSRMGPYETCEEAGDAAATYYLKKEIDGFDVMDCLKSVWSMIS